MIRLHHCHQTRSMRSLWLLHELGIDFHLQVYPFDAAIKSPEYLKLNPAGRVPTLELDGHVICESGAIAEALCETFAPDTLGRSKGHAERFAWLDWVHYAETISQHCAALTQQHIMLFEDAMRSPVIMKLEARRLAKTLARVDLALHDRDYLLASGFSAADIGVGQAAYMAQHFVRFDDMPALRRWFELITARPAFVASLPPGPGLYDRDFYPVWEMPK